MKPALTLVVALSVAGAVSADPPRPVKVFILAGQSNMEGKAKVSLLEYQVEQPKTRPLFQHLKPDGKWVERPDVWVKYLGKKGRLTVGYGRPKSIGPELGFGLTVGDRYDEPVLLIKTAWGGRSLYRDFRSPGAGLPPALVLEKMLADLKKRQPDATLADVQKSFGASYREMLQEVRGTLDDLKTHFPDYAGLGYELAGFVWFQGWNDMISPEATAEYAKNFARFIDDVRKDLRAPELPFVIGQMGVDGLKPNANIQRFKDAQAAVLKEPRFQGNVALVKTDVFWDTEAEAVFQKGWREHLEEWNKVGSDFPYHYLGSPRTVLAIGGAFGEAVLGLRGDDGKAARPQGAKPAPKKAAADKKVRAVAGAAEFLRVLPKPFGVVRTIDPAARTVTLRLDGEKDDKTWDVNSDAEVWANGFWGRLEQFKAGDRVWVWLGLDRTRKPVSVVMLADEVSTQVIRHDPDDEPAAPPTFTAEQVETRRTEQRAYLQKVWGKDGLPGTVTFNHVFSGELDVMLDHEAMRWGRALKYGDAVELTADPPVKAVVKTVSPWRERTQVRLVVGQLQAAGLRAGQRIGLRVPAPPPEVDASPYPSDLGHPRSAEERVEWFLASTYCVCGVGKDTCTGHFYTLASCNPNGCGAPNATREWLRERIAAGESDRQIWDTLLADRGPLITRPHLKP